MGKQRINIHETGSLHLDLIKIIVAFFIFAFGGYVYLAYRTTTLRMFKWFKEFGLYEFVSQIRKDAYSGIIPDFVLFSLPDGLWIVSYILIMDVLWSNSRILQIIWAFILPFVGVSSEIMQGLNIVNGTYDPLDILCYIIPYLFYITYKISHK